MHPILIEFLITRRDSLKIRFSLIWLSKSSQSRRGGVNKEYEPLRFALRLFLLQKPAIFTIHSCKFRKLRDFTGEGVMSHLHEHHPPTHDVTRHAESRPKRVTSHTSLTIQ